MVLVLKSTFAVRAEYVDACFLFGPDSAEVAALRLDCCGLPGFEEFADGIDKMRRLTREKLRTDRRDRRASMDLAPEDIQTYMEAVKRHGVRSSEALRVRRLHPGMVYQEFTDLYDRMFRAVQTKCLCAMQ